MNSRRRLGLRFNRRLVLCGLSLAAMGLIGCRGGLGLGEKHLEGTYVNHTRGEFSVADDTLLVEQVKHERYLVLRRTGFTRLEQGQPGERGFKKERWKAVFDPEKATMTVSNKGLVLVFERDSLVLENCTYRKIK